MITTSDQKVCAWLSRHQPTVNQIHSLRQYGIVQVFPPRGENASGRRAWDRVMRVCGCTPDLVVAVLPRSWGREFLKLGRVIAPHIPVLRAEMIAPEYVRWSGRWRCLEVKHDDIEWYWWTPE